MNNQICDNCGASMREGDYGEARWICNNTQCEKFNPNWPGDRLANKLKQINDEIKIISKFSLGTIEMFTARWVGDGSFEVCFNDGREIIRCDVHGAEVVPDIPEINDEIRIKLHQLIQLRKKLSAAIHGII